MPFGAVFTSSSGGDITGGRLYTRFRGPLLVGAASTAMPGGQTMQSTGNVAGSAAQPMYSYYTASNLGHYAFAVTTSAAEQREAVAGVDIRFASTAGTGVFTASFGSTAATTPLLYISQTTATSVPGVAPAVASMAGAALSWDSAAKTLEVYSTVTGAWMRLHSSGGANLTFSSS